MKKHNFKKDLKDGELIEIKLENYLKKKYPSTYRTKGYFKEYDIAVPEKDIKIEFKRDIGSTKTDNFFIEYECNNNPSGIVTTKADYWVVYTGKELLWITPIKIIECITINNISSRTLTGQGDTASKVACLIPIETFKKYCFKIENI